MYSNASRLTRVRGRIESRAAKIAGQWPILIVVAAIFVMQAPDSQLAQSQTPALNWADCPPDIFNLPDANSATMSCGRLRVPEDRRASAGSWIDLSVVVVSSGGELALPPLLYLAGGPGDAATSEISSWIAAGLHQQQDIIFINLRGSGLSEPSLDCPEFDSRIEEEPLIACRGRLIADGINLAAYNPTAITADIVDLISAMRLDTVNIYGLSFGARLGWRVALQLPDRINALVLDSVLPPGVSVFETAAANSARALQRMFADCSAEPACNSVYPELQAQFTRAVADLNDAPVEIEGLLPNAALRLDGAGFVRLLREMLTDSNRLPYIPAFISAVANGDNAVLAELDPLRLVEDSDADSHSEGLYMSAICADELAATSAEKIVSAAENLPSAYVSLARSALELLDDCALWTGETATHAPTLPARLDIPTLFLHGRYDPIAPQLGTKFQASRSWSYEDPQLGHGVLAKSTCAQNATQAFLAEQVLEPLHGCMRDSQRLEFYIPRGD